MAAWGQFSSGITGERGAYGFGQSFGDVLITIGTAGAGFAEGGAFSRLAYVTRWDSAAGMDLIAADGLKAGSFVQRGKGSFFEYMLSGSAQQGYRYGNRLTTLVPKSALKAPPGWEAGKYLIGQRTTVVPFKF